MKKKQDEEGNYYIFSTDKGIETLCLMLIRLTRDIDTTMTFTQKLWEAAFNYVEIADKDSMIFKRKPNLSEDNKYYDDVFQWIDTAIKTITDTLNIKEKYINPTFKSEKENNKGVGYKMDEDGLIYSYNILLPYTYLKTTQEDFRRILNSIQMEFDELSCQKHYSMIYDIETNKSKVKKLFPSVEIVKELRKETKKEQLQSEFKFSNRDISNSQKIKIKRQDSVNDVFDNIN